MMHLEILVEEPSAAAALSKLLPKVLGIEDTFNVYPYAGKMDLLSKLPARLNGYKKWLPENYRIIVLIDRDRQDCTSLKSQLEDMARTAGLTTKSSEPDNRFQVLNRIADHELESWFLGDLGAVSAAFPRINPRLQLKEKYRNPDSIEFAWETLERLLQRSGYCSAGYEKIDGSKKISAHLNPKRNVSKSFNVFINGLQAALK